MNISRTHTFLTFNLLLFHDNNGYANAPRYHITRALSGLDHTLHFILDLSFIVPNKVSWFLSHLYLFRHVVVQDKMKS
jgi:hypothetical protein